jgi:hypothetical protein
VTATPTKNGSTITIKFQPGSALPALSSHTATITYGSRTESWTFTVPDYIKDVVAGYAGVILGSPVQTADQGGASGAAGDLGLDLTRSGAALRVTGSAFLSALNAATAADELSVSMWIKKYDIANSSAFWFSGTDQDRAFQAHTPWSDNNVYFDTGGGCCDGSTQRISLGIDQFPGFTGDTTDTSWWQNWRLYTFSKKADVKEVYIDGTLFLQGSSLNPISTLINEMIIAAERGGTANRMHAVIDDYAVYSKALTAANITALKSGTRPTALAGAGLIALWDFNAVAATPAQITAVSVAGGNITITWTGGGTLQKAAAVNGPYSNIAGATTGTFTGAASAAAEFFRVAQ